jgi:hypothetical protein
MRVKGGQDEVAGLEGEENALLLFRSYCGMSETLHFEKTILELLSRSTWYPSAVGAPAAVGMDAAARADALAGGKEETLLLL